MLTMWWKRLIFDLLLFLSVFLSPWWFVFGVLFLGVFIFKNFYEFIIASIIYYVIFYLPIKSISPILFSVIIFSLYLIIQVFKKHIILYKNEISY
jgi:hypothetical protein